LRLASMDLSMLKVHNCPGVRKFEWQRRCGAVVCTGICSSTLSRVMTASRSSSGTSSIDSQLSISEDGSLLQCVWSFGSV
jgi:hypothetical protein